MWSIIQYENNIDTFGTIWYSVVWDLIQLRFSSDLTLIDHLYCIWNQLEVTKKLIICILLLHMQSPECSECISTQKIQTVKVIHRATFCAVPKEHAFVYLSSMVGVIHLHSTFSTTLYESTSLKIKYLIASFTAVNWEELQASLCYICCFLFSSWLLMQVSHTSALTYTVIHYTP